MDRISTLLSTKKTVFSIYELEKIFFNTEKKSLKQYLFRAKKDNTILNPFKGIRALPNYDQKELACKIKKICYISCETVLFKEGVFFQYHWDTWSCMSERWGSYSIDQQNYVFYHLKPELLNNPIGIKKYDNYRIATPERALCDYIYLHPKSWIDAPESINRIRLKTILPYYPKATVLAINKLLDVEY